MIRIIVELDNGQDVVITPHANATGKIDLSDIDMTLDFDTIDLLSDFRYHFATPKRASITLTCDNIDAVLRVRPASVGELLRCPECHKAADVIQGHKPTCSTWLQLPEDKRPAGWGTPGAQL